MTFDPHECAAKVLNGPLGETLAEYDRKTAVKNNIGIYFILAGAGLFLAPLQFLIPSAVIIIGILFIGAAYHNRRNYFRSVIIPELFQEAVPELKYVPDMGISRQKFASLDLFPSFDRYSSEDKISGTIGKTKFTAAEVHIEKKHKSKDKTYYSTIFKGVVLIADFNKELNSRTVVLPDVAERCFGKLIGNFFQKMNFTAGSLVKLENPEFEKLFAVYGYDQIEARYVLTPKMMEQLIRLRNSNKSEVRLLFEGDHVAVAFAKPSGWLEPPSFSRLHDINVLEKILYELISVISIINDLDLNTRIWTKE